jgi:hypothetical protein
VSQSNRSGPWAVHAYPGPLDPPGTYTSTVNHPSRPNAALDIGIVHEHRFSFWFWNKWRRKNKSAPAPALVTIDWHQDLGFEDAESLNILDTDNENEVALYTWSQLNPLNDGQILAAAWLDIIGDVYVLCKQDEPEEWPFETPRGTSTINVFHDPERFIQRVQHLDSIFLDIDLDFFTERTELDEGEVDVRLSPSDQMDMLLAPSGLLIPKILQSVEGVTIAVEPEWCGGLTNAHQSLAQLNYLMFNGTLLAEDVRWARTRLT